MGILLILRPDWSERNEDEDVGGDRTPIEPLGECAGDSRWRNSGGEGMELDELPLRNRSS